MKTKQKFDLVVGDADALVALANPQDTNHESARKAAARLLTGGATVLFPASAFLEAVTACQRRLSHPQVAAELVQQLKRGKFMIAAIDHNILEEASAFFQPRGSKKNTMFDAVVAATARRYGTNSVFSFDRWYKTQGFSIAPNFQ